jgi:hypothetical protein
MLGASLSPRLAPPPPPSAPLSLVPLKRYRSTMGRDGRRSVCPLASDESREFRSFVSLRAISLAPPTEFPKRA